MSEENYKAKLQGTSLPNALQLLYIKKALSGPAAKKSIAYALKNDGQNRDTIIHYLMDPEAARLLLTDPDNDLSLKHYDQNLGPLPGPVNLLLGEENGQALTWKILAAALAYGDEKIDRLQSDKVESIATSAAIKVIARLKKQRTKNLNLVREYGYIVPYLCAEDIIGLVPVRKASLGLRAYVMLRNLRDPSGFLRTGAERLRLTPDNISANTYLLWAHFMFGQIFGNFGLKNKAITAAAGYASKRFCKQIMLALDEDSALAGQEGNRLGLSVTERLNGIQNSILQKYNLTEAEYDQHCKCLVLELVSSFHILIGMAFANLIDVLNTHDVKLGKFAAALQSNDPDSIFLIDKALSLNSPTAMLYRTARRAFQDYGIAQGDIVCVLTADATKNLNADALAVLNSTKKPHEHMTMKESLLLPPKAEERSAYLTFGPYEKCPYSNTRVRTRNDSDVAHPCFGQFWARSILKAMVTTLVDETHGWPDIEPLKGGKGHLKKFQQLPDSLMVKVQ